MSVLTTSEEKMAEFVAERSSRFEKSLHKQRVSGQARERRDGNAVYSRINYIASLPLNEYSHIVLYSSPHKCCCLLLIKTL